MKETGYKGMTTLLNKHVNTSRTSSLGILIELVRIFCNAFPEWLLKNKTDNIPTMDEFKQVVMFMNPHSAPDPNGVGGKFYQLCWEIIKEDLLAAV